MLDRVGLRSQMRRSFIGQRVRKLSGPRQAVGTWGGYIPAMSRPPERVKQLCRRCRRRVGGSENCPLDCTDRRGCVRRGVHQRPDEFHKRSMLGTGGPARKKRAHFEARWLAAGWQVRLVLDVYASGRFSAQVPSVSIGALVQLTAFRLHASQLPLVPYVPHGTYFPLRT